MYLFKLFFYFVVDNSLLALDFILGNDNRKLKYIIYFEDYFISYLLHDFQK